VLGAVVDTLPEVIDALGDRPVGFISFDLDLYSSTTDALQLFSSKPDLFLPVVVSYFDDVTGGPGRIGSLFRTAGAGQLLAIDEFNQQQALRRIDPLRILRYRRPLDREPWLERMYALHVLDHPLRNPIDNRRALSMDEHRTAANLDWPM
jgi:hypothetical protein